MIRKITARNFKSFKEMSVSFTNFNVVIGPNASGKSNFISLLRFLRDVEEHGLENAISLQGGRDYFLNLSIGRSEPFYLSVLLENNNKISPIRIIKKKDGEYGIRSDFVKYELEIMFNKRGKNFRISKESLRIKYNLEIIKNDKERHINSHNRKFELLLKNKQGKLVKEWIGDERFGVGELLPIPFEIFHKLPKRTSLLSSPIATFLIPAIRPGFFRNISFYDFYPKSMKKASPIAGKVYLEEDASNLPVVLKRLLSTKKTRTKLVDLIEDLLPFISDMRVIETTDKSLRLELKEVFSKDIFLPSTLLSDGTAHITALIIALYFTSNNICVFEEPERNIHPALIFQLIDHMKDVANKKQIIITTHNTNFLTNVNVNDVIFISRNKDGYSVPERLNMRDDIKHFLKNEIGIDELFASNLLVAG